MSKDKAKETKTKKKPVSPRHPSQVDCLEGLNSKQSSFVRHYLILGVATKAAREAGYPSANAGKALMQNERVAFWIRKLKKEVVEKLEITKEKVIEELGRIAFGNLTDVVSFSEKGITIKNSNLLSADVKAAIQEVSETVSGRSSTLKVKMHDKLGALDKLGKHFNIYEKADNDSDGDPLEALRKAILGSQPKKEEESVAKVEEDEED